jgi:hypothetical protein
VYEFEYRTTAFNCKRSNAWNSNAIHKHTSLYAKALDTLPLTAGRLQA